jgi:hypothetical protein
MTAIARPAAADGWGMRFFVFVLLCSLAVPAFCGEAAQESDTATLIADFLQVTDRLEDSLDSLAQQTVQSSRSSDALRKRCHALIEPWHRRLAAIVEANAISPASDDEKQSVARASLEIADAWSRLAKPRSLLGDLSNQYPAWVTALGWMTDSDLRRSYLAGVADRVSSTPGTTDLDVLCAVVGWQDVFFADLPAGKKRVHMMTADLILIFTDRAADGFSKSGSALYRVGRCRDSGLREGLRDGSDQIRHFCWALRLFATGGDPDSVEQLLRMKEARDATQRGIPVNQADIELNRTARELMEQLHNLDRGTPGAERCQGLFRVALAGRG